METVVDIVAALLVLALIPAWVRFLRGPLTKTQSREEYRRTGVLTIEQPRSVWFYFSRFMLFSATFVLIGYAASLLLRLV